jgi:hypothetical protein
MSRICSSCGKEILNDSMGFCSACGAKLDDVQQNTAEQSGYQQYNGQQYGNPQYGQTYNQPYNQVYNQQFVPQYQQDFTQLNITTSVIGWIGWLLLCSILPLIGQIIMICTAKDKSAKNFAKANLVVLVICVVIAVICCVLFASSTAYMVG